MAAPSDGDHVEQPGSGLQRTPGAPAGQETGKPGSLAAVDPSSVVPSPDPWDWPEWARTRESKVGQLETRPPAGEAVGVSRSFMDWNSWRAGASHRRAAANPGLATVVVTATCTSIVVSLLTVWLTAPDRLLQDESVGTVVAPDEPVEPIGFLRPAVVAALPAGIAAVPVAYDVGLSGPAAPPEHAAPPTARSAGAAPGAQSSGAAVSSAPVLVVITEPEGARVTINGIAFGTSPLTVRHLTPGDKRIRVTKSGYRGEERVVGAGETRNGVTLRIELRKSDPDTPQ